MNDTSTTMYNNKELSFTSVLPTVVTVVVLVKILTRSSGKWRLEAVATFKMHWIQKLKENIGVDLALDKVLLNRPLFVKFKKS